VKSSEHFGEFLEWLIIAAVFGAVLFVGWNEPLRYRFMSEAKIREYERANEQVKMGETPLGKSAKWQPQGTSLDRGAYRTDTKRQNR
jgi:hypothetical protein